MTGQRHRDAGHVCHILASVIHRIRYAGQIPCDYDHSRLLLSHVATAAAVVARQYLSSLERFLLSIWHDAVGVQSLSR